MGTLAKIGGVGENVGKLVMVVELGGISAVS